MNSLTKIFIAERDCESLVNTMLWLEQYADFDVYGSAITDTCLKQQIDEVQPDIVMFGVPTLTAEAMLTIKLIRSASSAPSVLLVNRTDTNVELLAAECDGQVGPKTSLREVADLIDKTVNRRRVTGIASSAVPMAKAG